jgi:ribosomal protein S18 acetylase RimI-like enzyme
MSNESVISIIPFNEGRAKDFARLNYSWISEHFTIEEHDREILDHPFEVIVEPGGEVFFAVTDDGQVVGTAAMIRVNDDLFELSKMAVSPEFQGKGISNALMDSCIEFARSRSAATIFLETNSKLPAALGLYNKYGFKHTPLDPNSEYSRANVRMELDLTGEV